MFLLASVSAALVACEWTQSPRAATTGSPARAHDASVADDKVSAPVRARGTIIEAERWEVVSEADDPFSDRMPEVSCAEDAYMTELLANEQVFSVDTGRCHYITARQSALRAVDKGEWLKARVWHFALSAGESATAHVALHLGDSSVLDETVPIPAAGGLLAVEVEAPQAFAAGTPVFFHLHNHGDNSWALVELSAGPKP
jgi:hypothetical protein